MPSAPRRAWYWRRRASSWARSGCGRGPPLSEESSTRIGNRPCSSGMRSEGLLTWKAPAAMKRTWSVRTGPYLVETVVPSTMGSRSRCTPSRETSGPWPPSRPAILSISSRKTIPDDWARSTACRATFSWSTRRASSSWVRTWRASGTGRVRRRVRPPNRPGSRSLMLTSISSTPWLDSTWKVGMLRSGNVHLDGAVLEPARPQLLAQLLASDPEALGGALLARGTFGGVGRPRRREEQVQEALLRRRLRPLLDRRLHLAPHHVHRRAHQVAHDRIHVAADVAHLRELARLHLHEGAA